MYKALQKINGFKPLENSILDKNTFWKLLILTNILESRWNIIDFHMYRISFYRSLIVRKSLFKRGIIVIFRIVLILLAWYARAPIRTKDCQCRREKNFRADIGKVILAPKPLWTFGAWQKTDGTGKMGVLVGYAYQEPSEYVVKVFSFVVPQIPHD